MSKSKWLWPLLKPWTYSPQGYLLEVVWNCYEMAGKPMPFAGHAFGVICGCKGKKIK